MRLPTVGELRAETTGLRSGFYTNNGEAGKFAPCQRGGGHPRLAPGRRGTAPGVVAHEGPAAPQAAGQRLDDAQHPSRHDGGVHRDAPPAQRPRLDGTGSPIDPLPEAAHGAYFSA